MATKQRESGLHVTESTPPLTDEQLERAREVMKLAIQWEYQRAHPPSLNLMTFISQRFGPRIQMLLHPIERRLPWVGERMAVLAFGNREYLPWRWSEQAEAARLIARLASGAASAA